MAADPSVLFLIFFSFLFMYFYIQFIYLCSSVDMWNLWIISIFKKTLLSQFSKNITISFFQKTLRFHFSKKNITFSFFKRHYDFTLKKCYYFNFQNKTLLFQFKKKKVTISIFKKTNVTISNLQKKLEERKKKWKMKDRKK